MTVILLIKIQFLVKLETIGRRLQYAKVSLVLFEFGQHDGTISDYVIYIFVYVFLLETCTLLVMANGEVMCTFNPVITGHECNVMCNDGYTPDQNAVTCQTGNVWSDIPICQGE